MRRINSMADLEAVVGALDVEGAESETHHDRWALLVWTRGLVVSRPECYGIYPDAVSGMAAGERIRARRARAIVPTVVDYDVQVLGGPQDG